MVWSPLAEARVAPSELNATLVWPVSGSPSGWRLVTSHRRILPSKLAEARVVPSGRALLLFGKGRPCLQLGWGRRPQLLGLINHQHQALAGRPIEQQAGDKQQRPLGFGKLPAEQEHTGYVAALELGQLGGEHVERASAGLECQVAPA